MIEDLSQPLDVSLLGGDGTEYRGTVALRQFARLRAELTDAPGEVRVHLRFAHDESGRRLLNGELQTELALTCQRCLQPMQLPVNTAFRLALLDPEDDPESLPASVEPVIVNNAQVNVLDLLEDELLLCLPIAPRHHADDQCEAPQRRPGSTFGDVALDRQNPFAVLRDLPFKQPPEKL